MTTRHYCTLFDRNYLIKGVTMLRSIARHSPGARVHVLCLDDSARALLDRLAIPGVTTLPLAAVETEDVLEAKRGRSVAEYCWTLSSVLLWHVMNSQPSIDLLTYLDADLMFFSDVEPIFDEMQGSSILAIEHRYTPRLQSLLPYGRFNVQWVSFRRDADGLDCLKTWRDQCVDWCFADVQPDRHGDQKYLDAWPQKYRSFHSLAHKGAGLAPWNYPNYTIESRGSSFTVDGQPLIFYHFHQFQIRTSGGYQYFSTDYAQDREPPKALYEAYWAAIQKTVTDVRTIEPGFSAGFRSASTLTLRTAASRWLPLPIKSALKKIGLRTW